MFPFPLRWFARVILFIMGWEMDFVSTVVPMKARNVKSVVIGHHTSNWDAIFGMLFQVAYDIPCIYAIKDEWMQVPIVSWCLSRLGFHSIGKKDAGAGTGSSTTESIVKILKNETSSYNYIIMPEGNRTATDKWKNGYFYIAKGAGASIRVMCMDYKNHVMKLVGDPISCESKQLAEVEAECRAHLISSSIPLYPREAYPLPICCSDKGLETSVYDLKRVIFCIVTFLPPVVAAFLIYA